MTHMTSRERVLTTFNRRVPDRAPKSAPSLVPAQMQVFRDKTATSDVNAYFRCDTRSLSFIAPDELPDFSQYYCDVEDYPFPDFIRDWKHDHFEDTVHSFHDQGFPVFGSVGHIFQTSWLMRSRERLFVDFLDNPKFADALLSRVAAIRTAMAVRYAEAGVDAIELSDDIAMQDRLMMSPAMWRQWLKPRLADLITAARRVKPDLHVTYHSDGKTEEVIGDLAEVGVTVLWTVQPECMEPAHIKREFGDRLAFAGTIGVQSTLPFAGPKEVRRTVKEHILTVGEGGGFLLCPANSVGPDVPWANIVAMYEAGEEFGAYGEQ